MTNLSAFQVLAASTAAEEPAVGLIGPAWTWVWTLAPCGRAEALLETSSA